MSQFYTAIEPCGVACGTFSVSSSHALDRLVRDLRRFRDERRANLRERIELWLFSVSVFFLPVPFRTRGRVPDGIESNLTAVFTIPSPEPSSLECLDPGLFPRRWQNENNRETGPPVPSWPRDQQTPGANFLVVGWMIKPPLWPSRQYLRPTPRIIWASRNCAPTLWAVPFWSNGSKIPRFFQSTF